MTDIPEPYGDVFTHMGWQLIKSKTSDQYKLKEKYGMNFDENGFGYIKDGNGNKYFSIACTSTFGAVGDQLNVDLKSGDSFRAVIGDIKSQNDKGCNKYGHQNGHCVVEFIVDKDSKDWLGYGGKKVPTKAWSTLKNNRVAKITYLGHFDF